MSLTIEDGQTISKDPSDVTVLTFDWDARHLGASVTISTSTWTLTGLSGDVTTTPMTKDQDSIVTGSRKTQIRLSAGCLGSTWELANTIVTNENPSQQINRKILVRVENR